MEEKLLYELQIISSEMKNGNPFGLYELKNLLKQLPEMSSSVKPEILNLLIVLDNLITNDIFKNFNKDTIGFPSERTSILIDIMKKIGKFIEYSLSGEKKEKEKSVAWVREKCFFLLCISKKNHLSSIQKENFIFL